MSLKFNFWSPPGAPTRGRIYVHGALLPGKVWIQRGRADRFQFSSDVPENLSDAVIESVLLELRSQGFVAQSDANPSFDALAQALRDPPKGRAGGSGNAAPSFPQRPPESASTHDLDNASIKLTQPIRIQVDHREPPQIVELLRQAPLCTVEVVSLELGDYLIDDKVIVERKTVGDFEASVIDDDKRLFNQTERMKHRPELLSVMILEGDVFGRRQRMSVQQISGSLTFLSMIQGMSVITSMDLVHTSYLLIKLGQHAGAGLGYELGLRAKKPKALLSARAYVLEGVPGVSAGLARVLLAHFGSIARLAAATEAELIAVPGIGKKRAEQIREVLSGSES